MDHLIAEGIEYVKNQEVESLTDENPSSQNDVNYVNQELIDFVKGEKDIGLTQDLQENVESVQSVSVPTKIIEGKIDDYSIQHSVISSHEENIPDIDIYDMVEMPDISTRITNDQVIEECMLEEEIGSQGIDECKTEKLQDIPIEVANKQELEECIQEQVVSGMTLPEIYRVDERIHTDVQLEIPIIKSEEGHIVQDEPKLVQDRTLICAIPNPLPTNAQAQHMTEQKVSLPDRTNIGKTIPTTYVSRGESLRSEVVRKEIPTYIDSTCRPPSKPTDKQNSVEGKICTKMLPYLNPIYMPPPKPPNTQNTKGKRKWIFRRKLYTKTACRSPLKPPYPFHGPSTISKKPYGELYKWGLPNKGKNEYKGFR